MNSAVTTHSDAAFEAAEARCARAIAARLTLRSSSVAPDIGERLRFARELALETAVRSRRAAGFAELSGSAQGVAALQWSGSPLWTSIVSVVPLLALVAGLFFIQNMQARSQIETAAEVDTALLGDDLPISAYRDPGFVEYLKSPPSQ